MELFSDSSGSFINPSMLLHMHHPRDFILPLRIGNDFFILKH